MLKNKNSKSHLTFRVFVLCMAEEEGFEPPRAAKPLAVFKTAPFSQAWVLLRLADTLKIYHMRKV